MDQIQTFANQVLGKVLRVTGPDAGQCTAVPHAWESFLDLPIVYGDAKDTFANASTYNREYDQTLNTPDNYPLPGAIIVWKEPMGAYRDEDGVLRYAGHTAVVQRANADTFTALSQNDPDGSPVISKTYDYTNVLGWFTPKKLLAGDSEVSTIVDENLAREIANLAFGWENVSDEFINSVKGQPIENVLYNLVRDDVHKDLLTRASSASGLQAANAALAQDAAVAKAQASGMSARILALQEELETAQAAASTAPPSQSTPPTTGLDNPVTSSSNGSPVSNPSITQYSKALVAASGFIGAVALAFKDGSVSPNELANILMTLSTAIGVYLVPNKK